MNKELREKQIGANENTNSSAQSKNAIKYVKEFLNRKQSDVEDFTEVRVAVVGNVDAGKSTLLGVLTHCVLDDGRGNARTKLFRHNLTTLPRQRQTNQRPRLAKRR